MSNLSGKVVAITGASEGIGRAIARVLAPLGARLVLNALQNDKLDAVAAELEDAEIVGGDISQAEVGERLLSAALDRFGRVDALVNNAGIFRHGPLDTIDLAVQEAMIALNFTAVVRNSYLFARVMKEQGGGHIINFSSISSTLTTPGCGAYAASKIAVEKFSDSLRIELAGTRVRVGVIAPGTTDTALFDHIPKGGKASSDLGVRKLEPTDLADAVRFMLERPEHANIPYMRLYSAEQKH